jgi:dihydrofolate reductase
MINTNDPVVWAIVAMAENRVIGKNNQLPWHLPADLKHFKDITTGNAILMGRKTFESIGKPLPNRVNLILTRDAHYKKDGCITVYTLEDAKNVAKMEGKSHIFIIGGAEVYHQFISQIEKIYLTIVHGNIEGDAFFPALDMTQWREIERKTHAADDKNQYSYSFLTLVRI